MPDDPSTEPTEDTEGLQNITPKGKAPPSRLKDYKAAADVVSQLVREDEYDRQDRVNEQALLDGQGPFIQADLDTAGLSWMRNVNYGAAASKSEQAQAPYGQLSNGFTAELDNTFKGVQRTEYQSIIAECFALFHSPRIWKDHDRQDQNLTRTFVNFGVGVADFTHPRSCLWDAGGLGEHYFQRPMRASEDAAKIHVRIREYKEDELWSWLQNPNAKAVGYNPDAIKDALLACNERNSGYGWTGEYEATLTNNVFGQTYSRNASVRLFTMRVVEMTKDGSKVSTCMGRADGQGTDYIYQSKKPDWQDSMSSSFVFFLAGIGNGDLHSIKGLAHKIFDTCQTENQFINRMYDYGLLSMSSYFEAQTTVDAQRLQSIKWGDPFIVLPQGVKPAEGGAFPNYANSIIPLINMSGAIGDRNTGVYQQSLTPASVEQTREEVIHRTMQNGVITSRAIDLYQDAKERQYNITRERIQRKDYNKNDPGFTERKKFFDAMEQRGIENPEEVFRHVLYIKPNRQVGGGSAAAAQMLLKEAGQGRAFLNPVQQQIYDKMVLTSLLGSENADVLRPTIDIQATTTQQRFAMDENTFMILGVQKPVLPDDDHYLHAMTHDAALPDVFVQFGLQQLGPGQSTDDLPDQQRQQLANFLNAFIPHQTAHLQALGNNPQQAKEIGQFNLDLNKAKQLQQHLMASAYNEQNRVLEAARAQQARQQQNPQLANGQPDPKLQNAIATAQVKLNAQNQAAQLDLAAKRAAHLQDLQQKAEKAQQELQLEQQKQSQQRQFDDADNAQSLINQAKQ